MLEACPSLSVEYRPLNLDEGKDLVLRNKAYAIFYIPSDFEKNIYAQKQPEVVSYVNNQYMLIGTMVSKDITTAVTTLETQISVLTKMTQIS